MLAHLLAHANTCVIGAPALVAEIVETAEKHNCQAVCISAVPPHALNHAAYLARRLRRHKPDLKIVVGLWMPDADVGTAKERLAKLGVDEVVAHVSEAADSLRRLAGGAKPPERQIASMDRRE